MTKAAVRAATAAQTALEPQQQLLPALKQLLASYCAADSSSRTQGSTAPQPVDTTDVNNPQSGAQPAQLRTLSAAASAHPPGQTAGAKQQQQQVLVPTLPGCNMTHKAWHSKRRSLYEEVYYYQNGSTICSSGSSPTNNSSRGHGTSSNSSSSAADPTSRQQFDPLSAALIALQQNPRAHQLTPSATVQQLDNHIVGQADAKRAVAVALRNRWRRHRLPPALAEEIKPKNLLMIGPTGCGKTEIARRLAQLVEAPFIKVEATKFTELGFVGRDVDEIVKDLMEASLTLTRTRLAEALREVADRAAEDIILADLIGSDTEDAKKAFRDLYRSGGLDGQHVELDLDALGVGGQGGVSTHSNPLQAFAAMMQMVGSGGGRGLAGRQGGKVRMKVSEARKLLIDNEIERSLNSDRVVREALRAAQQDGIVFIDEIDKIVETSRGVGGATSSNVSSEGVQRDLLPILEGSVVPTKYGNVSTDHVLFIASGAFHSSKPSDMLAELQGRLPVRVELAGLTAEDFYRILTEPQHNMIKQQQVLLATEGVDLVFTDGAVRAIAEAAHQANRLLDNIGARRLHTVVERVLADISFTAPEKVAEAKQQQQQQAAQPAATSSGKGSKSRGSGSSKSSPKAKGKGSKEAAGSGSSSRSSSPDGSSSREPPALLRYEVTEDMVRSCMEDVLKQKDLSRYML